MAYYIMYLGDKIFSKLWGFQKIWMILFLLTRRRGRIDRFQGRDTYTTHRGESEKVGGITWFD